MIFLDQYSEINALFGELGWGIGSLADSSRYDERYVAIADAVIALNEDDEPVVPSPTHVFIMNRWYVKATFKGQIIALLDELKEQEGFQWSVVGYCVDIKPEKRHTSRRRHRGYNWWTVMKAWWNVPYGDAQIIIPLFGVILILAVVIIICIPHANGYYAVDGVRYESRDDIPASVESARVEPCMNIAGGICIIAGVFLLGTIGSGLLIFFPDSIDELKQVHHKLRSQHATT